jgi:hypothetical protein
VDHVKKTVSLYVPGQSGAEVCANVNDLHEFVAMEIKRGNQTTHPPRRTVRHSSLGRDWGAMRPALMRLRGVRRQPEARTPPPQSIAPGKVMRAGLRVFAEGKESQTFQQIRGPGPHVGLFDRPVDIAFKGTDVSVPPGQTTGGHPRRP